MRPKPTTSFPAVRARATRLGLALVAALVPCACAGNAPTHAANPGSQIAFGSQMAARGLWAEAKFRFEQAAKLDPSNGRALGNLAVAYEALGQFEEARVTYERALQVDPGNLDIKRNQARFSEFYASFRGAKDAKPPAPPPPPPAPPATATEDDSEEG